MTVPVSGGGVLSRALRKLNMGRHIVRAIPLGWLTLFFLVPFLVVLKISFAETAIAIPPYTSLLEWDAEEAYLTLQLNLGNFLYLFEDSLYLDAYLSSIRIAGIATILALLVGFPMAYVIARARSSTRTLLLALVILPFWTSFLLRVYSWMALLKQNGPVNDLLMLLGIVDAPVQLLQTDFAVFVGIVYTYLPFMILPLYSTLEKMDMTLLEAAADLGAKPWQSFFQITVPLAMPGIIAGCMLVFIPAVGEYVIPALLGGSDTLMIGRVLWDEFTLNRDWPMASAVAIVMLLFLVLPIMFLRNRSDRVED